MKKDNTLELLEKIRNKGGCFHTQKQADSLMYKLEKLIDSKDYTELQIAYTHIQLDEGPAEFYEVVKKLKTKYARKNRKD